MNNIINTLNLNEQETKIQVLEFWTESYNEARSSNPAIDFEMFLQHMLWEYNQPGRVQDLDDAATLTSLFVIMADLDIEPDLDLD